eukprot:CAMPEP_0178909906 /NCGR_PEP_ID=MMETSP0786-20121207/8797_1 /TAXON_ID=186022 /ORGANISM="Thalassionema frauenfeldii, Strain CCMP 1798" /LENGTH=219 /DNA_ID=CAMNT_0020582089 /DNA_START=61 /DNA_END=721 /DNA_ORIENTATION=+
MAKFAYAARYRSYLTPPSNPFREGKTKLQMVKEVFLVLLLAALLITIFAQTAGKIENEQTRTNEVGDAFSEERKQLRGDKLQYVPGKDVTSQGKLLDSDAWSLLEGITAEGTNRRDSMRTMESIRRTSLDDEDEKEMKDNAARESNSFHNDPIRRHRSEALNPLNEAGNKSFAVEQNHRIPNYVDNSDSQDILQVKNQIFVENEENLAQSPEAIGIKQQ